ncbi:L,D-transpeptidase [Herbiconiux sp.]|uniref:L,D-transpeptidase n=1 Tax=Herbiconiux sp. TaxID=1871186 RepID=UPI0025B9A1DC|nr:L,D-transpeptidase [Herbiconiux sp.]
MVGALAFSLAGCVPADQTSLAPATLSAAAAPDSPSAFQEPTPAEVAALPEATYDAVISGLLPFSRVVDSPVARFHLEADAPMYGADRHTPVARLAASNFLGEDTVVVPVEIDGDWAMVLTPSRQLLPSQNGGSAPAQSAAWIRVSELTQDAELPARIDVSVGKQTLTITNDGQPDITFPVGIGAPDTPTPTGVTGYLQARYLDPAQDETVYPIQLTSLHSSAADEPFGGSDGGLIGIHFQEENTGQVSHGCIRLSADAITAVNALPLGTLISITP